MNKNKELMAVFVGFSLIILVVAFTFLRPDKKSENVGTPEETDNVSVEWETISPTALQEKIKNGNNVKIVDIRPFELYISEHIIDSINVPIEEIKAYEIKPDEEIVLLAEASQSQETTLADAITAFKEKGATNITVLGADIASWKNFSGLTVTYGDPTVFSDQSKVAYISQEELKGKLDTNSPSLIIDVREKEKFDAGHLPKAVNIPLLEIEKRRSEVSLSKPVIIYTNIEAEAFQAAVRLYDMKFITASVLKEGFSKWSANNFPIEK